jgi:hypothetical protein
MMSTITQIRPLILLVPDARRCWEDPSLAWPAQTPGWGAGLDWLACHARTSQQLPIIDSGKTRCVLRHLLFFDQLSEKANAKSWGMVPNHARNAVC